MVFFLNLLIPGGHFIRLKFLHAHISLAGLAQYYALESEGVKVSEALFQLRKGHMASKSSRFLYTSR